MTVLSKGTKFEPQLITDLVDKVKGKSSLAKMSAQTPIPFNGVKEFTFTMDSEIDVVAENGKKSHGGVSIEPRTIVPIKIEYGARVSNEFMITSEEQRIEILKAFNDGFAKKVARGLDLMAFHGVNPRTGLASTVIGPNHFDSVVTQQVTYTAANPDENIEAGIALVQGAGNDVTGLIMSSAFSSALGAMRTADTANVRLFPELAWGANPGTINGLKTDINDTVNSTLVKDRAILGDFENNFKWGYAKEIPMKIITAGDPDGTGKDLNNYNQVYIRAEMFLGWGILDPNGFARIVETP